LAVTSAFLELNCQERTRQHRLNRAAVGRQPRQRGASTEGRLHGTGSASGALYPHLDYRAGSCLRWSRKSNSWSESLKESAKRSEVIKQRVLDVLDIEGDPDILIRID
jgi:hypothetical protein